MLKKVISTEGKDKLEALFKYLGEVKSNYCNFIILFHNFLELQDFSEKYGNKIREVMKADIFTFH